MLVNSNIVFFESNKNVWYMYFDTYKGIEKVYLGLDSSTKEKDVLKYALSLISAGYTRATKDIPMGLLLNHSEDFRVLLVD